MVYCEYYLRAQSAWPPPCLFFFLGSHREDVRLGGGVFVWTYCSTSLYSTKRAFQDKDTRQPLAGGNARDFFLDLLQHLHVLCQTRASKDKDTLQPWGGMLVISFWTISAANPDRTMRSARPPLFVTLFDTLLGRFWRFLGSFWRPERGLGPTWGYLGISKVKVCIPSLHF